MDDITTGRESDRYTLRLPDGLRETLKTLAASNGRTLNGEILARLNATIKESDVSHTVAQLLEALLTQTRQRGGSRSVRQISDACIDLANAIAAYTALRKTLLTVHGMTDAPELAELHRCMARLSKLA